MELKIKSQKLNRIITFSRPGSYYIYADINGQGGTLGKQICKGGNLLGNTIGYTGNCVDTFNKICRKWYRESFR